MPVYCIVPGICPWISLGSSRWLQEAPRIYHHLGRTLDATATDACADDTTSTPRSVSIELVGEGGGAPLFNLVAGTSIKGAGVMDMPPLGEDIAVEGTGDGRKEGKDEDRKEGRMEVVR